MRGISSSTGTSSDLAAKITQPSKTAPGAHEVIYIDRPSGSGFPSYCSLEISLCRTMRVSDNTKTYELPPKRSNFPIYSVTNFKDKLTHGITKTGEFLVPMYSMLKGFPRCPF
jgi:hypothetical protein